MQALANTRINTLFFEILDSLSPKEKKVISKRVWLNWEKETLQSIGDSFSPKITRERVRQIEDTWIKKLGRYVEWTDLMAIQKKAAEIINLHEWIIEKSKLINSLIKELKLDTDVNEWIIEVIIHSAYEISKSKPKIGMKTYFHVNTFNKKVIDLIHKEAIKILSKKKDIVDKEILYSDVVKSLQDKFKTVNIILVDSVLDLFEDIIKWEERFIGLTKWKILNPKTLKDKAIYVMKKERIPMHFVDLSNKITSYLWDTVKVNTIHNELIRNGEFVLIGRWIYALKEWGFKPGTVMDVIVDILKKANSPMSTEAIVAKVLKIRNVKKTTIYMNLQNKKVIERVWRNYYQLKD